MNARAWLLAFFLAPAVHVAQDATRPEAPTGREARREQVLTRLRSYADRIAGFESPETRVRGWTFLAARICKTEKALGAELLERAATVQLPTGAPKEVENIRRELIHTAGACDPQLAKKLGESVHSKPAEAEADAAGVLLDEASRVLAQQQKEMAVSIAAKAIGSGNGALFQENSAPVRGMNSLVSLLRQLRLTDTNAADQLFLKAVDQLAATPQPSRAAVLGLGLYVFASGEADEPPGSLSIHIVAAGGSDPLVVLRGSRDLPRELTASYLSAAVDVLRAQPRTPSHNRGAYGALAHLLPKIREFLPERVAQVESDLHLLEADIPPSAAASLRNIGNNPRESDDEESILKLPSDDERDPRLLSLAWKLKGGKQFDRARGIAERISLEAARDAVMAAISLEEGSESLRRNDTERAEAIAAQLPAGPERCLLRLGIARRRAATDRTAALEGVFAALEDVPAIQGPAPQLLTAAHVLAPLDTRAALSLLQQAVSAINRQVRPAVQHRSQEDRARRQPVVQRSGRHVEINLPPTSISFSLHSVGQADINMTASALAGRDFVATEEMVLAISDEMELAQALGGLAQVLLNRLN